MFYGEHCTNARAQWELSRCPIFELICDHTCCAGWRGAQLLLIGHTWECGERRDAVARVVLQGAGAIMYIDYRLSVLNIGVVCALYLLLVKFRIVLFCNFLIRGPILKPHAVIP